MYFHVGLLFVERDGHLGLGTGLLGKEDSLYVRQDTALGNGHTLQKLVQLLVVADGELKVAWNDPLLLVVPRSVAGQLQNLCCQVLHHGCHVDPSTSSNPLGVGATLQQQMYPPDWKLEARPHRLGH
jgi:hypothetical protein